MDLWWIFLATFYFNSAMGPNNNNKGNVERGSILPEELRHKSNIVKACWTQIIYRIIKSFNLFTNLLKSFIYQLSFFVNIFLWICKSSFIVYTNFIIQNFKQNNFHNIIGYEKIYLDSYSIIVQLIIFYYIYKLGCV